MRTIPEPSCSLLIFSKLANPWRLFGEDAQKDDLVVQDLIVFQIVHQGHGDDIVAPREVNGRPFCTVRSFLLNAGEEVVNA